MKAIILGSGPSAKKYVRRDGDWVIGCNDAYTIFGGAVDAIAVVDSEKRLRDKRPDFFKTPANIPVYAGGNATTIKMPNLIPMITSGMTITATPFSWGNRIFPKTIPLKAGQKYWSHGTVCPHFACSVALSLGYTHLEIWGVDLNDGQYNDQQKSKIIEMFATIAKAVSELGGSFEWCNGSPLYASFLEKAGNYAKPYQEPYQEPIQEPIQEKPKRKKKAMTYTVSASINCGDIIYALPMLKDIYERTGNKCELQICDTHKVFSRSQAANTYEALNRLLIAQEYIEGVSKINEALVDKAAIKLDIVLKHPKFRLQPIPASHFMVQNLPVPWLLSSAQTKWPDPWLRVGIDSELEKRNLHLINATNKFKHHTVNWRAHFDKQKDTLHNFAFIGLQSEYDWFSKLIGHKLEYLPCMDLLDVAIAIKSSAMLICEQSSPLTIAQGLGKYSMLAKDTRFNNCTWNGSKTMTL